MIKFKDFIYESKSMTWKKAIIKALTDYDSLTAAQIWNYIKDNDLIETKSQDPLNSSIYPLLQRHTDNIEDKRSGESIFTSSGNPRRFSLIKKSDYKFEPSKIDVKDFTAFSGGDITFLKAAQIILKENGNKPMTSNEIWSEISKRNLVKTTGKTPWSTLNAKMLTCSDNSNIQKKYKSKLFTIVETNPAKFILINPNSIQEVDESELSEDQVVKTETNPFRQSICILGKSGRGKSTTIDNLLYTIDNMEHEFIIPTATTTALLSQYSPTTQEYKKSRLGKLIIDAHDNPNKLFTAVFDECHKSSVIEMINDELLQCISLRRNNGKRFISVDSDTAELFKGLEEYRGNLLIPDNFGFIFLSSKPDVITRNSDFFNRVDIYVMKKIEDYKNIDYSNLYVDGKLNSEYFTLVEGKSMKDIEEIERLNDAD